MFDNTVTIAAGNIPAVSITDTDNGRTIRRHNSGGGMFQELVISRQESNENKGTITDRYLVQLAHLSIDATTGKPVRASASLVIAYPRINADHASMNQLVVGLVSFLIGAVGAGSVTNLETTLGRIYNGET